MHVSSSTRLICKAWEVIFNLKKDIKKSPTNTYQILINLGNFVGQKKAFMAFFLFQVNSKVWEEPNSRSFLPMHLFDKSHKLFTGIFIIWIFKILKKPYFVKYRKMNKTFY